VHNVTNKKLSVQLFIKLNIITIATCFSWVC